MMKKCLLRALALCLVGVMSFTKVGLVNPLASQGANDIISFTVISETIDENAWVEISKDDERVYFFRDTAVYTIAMDLHLEAGILNVYRRDKQLSIMAHDTTDYYASLAARNGGLGQHRLPFEDR